MKPSSAELIGAIARTLETEILPEVDAGGWAASRLRSSLMLLRHLEQRVALEGPLLYRENADLEALLRALAVELTGEGWAADLVLQSVGLVEAPAIEGYPDVSLLSRRNERCQVLLDAFIVALHEQRASLGEERFARINRQIVETLAVIKSREAPLIDAVTACSPI
jgi:hypothetical protein